MQKVVYFLAGNNARFSTKVLYIYHLFRSNSVLHVMLFKFMQIIHAYFMWWDMTGNAPITSIEMLTLFAVSMFLCHMYYCK